MLDQTGAIPEYLAAARFEPDRTSFADVVGTPARRVAMELVADWRAERGPIGALLHGPPGIGKTYLSRAMATELAAGGFEIYELSAAELDAERVRLLGHLSPGRRILIIDEVDLWAVHRDSLSHTPATRATLLALLALLDGIRVLRGMRVLMLTSRPAADIDPALLRPGRATPIELPYPDLAGRTELLRLALRSARLAPELDLERAAIVFGSGATPAEIVSSGAAVAARHDKLDWPTLRDALSGSEAADPALLHRTALHEAGHAIVAARLGLPVHNIIIEPGRGLTELSPRHPGATPSDHEASARITVAMAGAAAEQILTSDALLGAADDHERASEWALARLRSGAAGGVGASALSRFSHSPAAADAVYASVNRQLRDGHRRAERLVRANADSIRALAQLLSNERQLSGTLLSEALCAPRRSGLRRLLAR